MADNLIKFKRGSQAAYDALKAHDNVDPDTLYFIYDKNAKEFPGFLYLGITPIAGFGDAPGSIPIVEVPEGSEVTEYLDENITEPQAGDLCIVDGDLYIYDGENWVSIYDYINDSKNDIADIESALKGTNTDYSPYGEMDQQTGEVRNIIDDLVNAMGNITNLTEIVNTLVGGGAVMYWEELEEETNTEP